MNRAIMTILAVLTAIITSSPAHAKLRFTVEDATLVERSELIAIARLKEDSIQYVRHNKTPNQGASWEYHATLVTTEVLKGKCEEKEISITIHYGLDPVVGGRLEHDGHMIDRKGANANYPKDIIEIMDTGTSEGITAPLVKDARQDNLWFLRKRSGTFGSEPGTGNFGIVDPEDLQPISLKNYFLAYMSKNPEAVVKECMQTTSAVAARAQRYLDHMEIQRILKIADQGERLRRLLPYYKKRQTWGMKSEVRDGLISCGNTAGDYLQTQFDDPTNKDFRRPEIILIWRDLKYKEAAPLLIALLKQHDRFWEKQELKKDWWSSNVEDELASQRRQIYSEVYYAVAALRAFKDLTAREAIELTKKRWEALSFDNPQIVEECATALKELPMTTATNKAEAR